MVVGSEDIPTGENLILSASFEKEGQEPTCATGTLSLYHGDKKVGEGRSRPTRRLRDRRRGPLRRPPRRRAGHRRLPRRAALRVHRRHNQPRRGRRQRRALRRPRAPRRDADPLPVNRMSTELGSERAGDLTREAYLFGFPLVYIATQIDVLTHVTKPQGARAPLNQFAHYRAFPDAANRTVVGFNVDTLYSLAQLDVAPEPLVLSVPEMGDRFWIMQLVDGWNNVPAAPGSRAVGGRGGDFAIVGPGSGRQPAGRPRRTALAHEPRDRGRSASTPEVGTTTKPCMRCRTSFASSRCRPGQRVRTAGRRAAEAGRAGCAGWRQVMALSAEAYFNRLNALLVDNPPEPTTPPSCSASRRSASHPAGPSAWTPSTPRRATPSTRA